MPSTTHQTTRIPTTSELVYTCSRVRSIMMESPPQSPSIHNFFQGLSLRSKGCFTFIHKETLLSCTGQVSMCLYIRMLEFNTVTIKITHTKTTHRLHTRHNSLTLKQTYCVSILLYYSKNHCLSLSKPTTFPFLKLYLNQPFSGADF